MERKSRSRTTRWRSESGMTLIETVLALVILFIATAGLMALSVVSIMTTENEGHLAARATEYAQDKMEQLVSLAYPNGDCLPLPGCGSDTTVFPTTLGGGTGLAAGGSSDPNAPVDDYVDYLDADGNPLGGGAVAPTGWYYMRVWQISVPAGTTNMKQITVTTKVRFGVGSGGALAQATLTQLKTNPF